MTEFTVNPTRFDPYKNFKFLVQWDGKIVPGISKISALSRTTDAVTHREGSAPNIDRSSPGLTSFAPIVLERGRTQDRAFEDWANKVWSLGAPLGAEVGLSDFRKDIRIELLNEAGQPVIAYLVRRCWPSEYVALAGLDSGANAVLIERLTLQNEGWERDNSVTEPHEPK
jgi:phage tail-like protein